MLKKLCAAMLGTALIAQLVPCGAISVGKLSVDVANDELTLTGKSDKSENGALVDFWLEDASNNIAVIRQTRTDENGDWVFKVDLSDSLKQGGRFSVYVTSQTDGKIKYISETGADTVELYISAEVDAVLKRLVSDKQDAEKNAENIKANRDILNYKVPLLKRMSKDNASELALFIKNSDFSEENAVSCLTKIAEIKAVQNGNGAEVLELFNTDGRLTEAKENTVFKKMDKELLPKFAQRLSASDSVYNTTAEFLTEVEDLSAVTQLYEARGTDGIEKTLTKFSEKFDFTVYERSGNNKKAVLNAVQKAFENKSVYSCAQVQGILDKYIKKTDGGSASGGGSSSGGSSGGVKNTVTAGGGLASKPVFDSENVKTDEKKFSDLTDYQWASESIYSLVKAGIVSGVSDTEFAPSRTITRAEFCKLIFKIFGMKIGTDNGKFSDVAEGDWFAPYVWALSDSGAINGIDNKHFAPDAAISRQDVCAIIYRILSTEGLTAAAGQPTFGDSENIAEYAREAAAALSDAGLITGEDGNFVPEREMSRAEAAVLAARVHSYRNGGRK